MSPVPTLRGRVIPPNWKPTHFFLDVDGVLTNGQFLYSAEGKAYKTFGPDDNDALQLLKPFLEVRFLSGDHRGFPITRKRVAEDMRMPLDLVSTTKRLEWIRTQCDPTNTVYMGDGLFDALVFAGVGYGICPGNGLALTKTRADFVTQAHGGDRAVAEACLHLLATFFTPFDPDGPPDTLACFGLGQ